MAAVSQPVECRSRETLTSQHLSPVLEGQIRRHDHTQTFVRRADHVEQQLRSQLAGRNVPQFVQNQQIQFRELSFQAGQVPIFAGFHQLSDQLGHLKEPDAFPLTTGRDSQRRREVRLAGS